MSRKTKYVKFDTLQMDLGVAYDVVMVFPGVISHACFAQAFAPSAVISAGFVGENEDGFYAYGRSVGLKVKADEKDTKLLRKLLHLA